MPAIPVVVPMAHKRTLSDADMPEHTAKVAAAEDDLPAGRPPSAVNAMLVVAAELPAVSPLDMFKHEKQWKENIDSLEALWKHLRVTMEAAALAKLTLGEQKAYDVGPIPCGATVDSSRRLVSEYNDDKRTDELEFTDSGIQCACCDVVVTSFNGFTLEYPQWRILGTMHYLCRPCRDRFEAGETLKVIRDEPTTEYRDRILPM